jgi:hypothetical protein
MARGSTRQQGRVARNEAGDRVGYWAVKNQPFVLGERTEQNSRFFDAVKDNKNNFQKLVAISSNWQDGSVGPEYKVAFMDAFNELPQQLKDLITEPKSKMKELYRGVKSSFDEMLQRAEDDFNDRSLPTDPDEQRQVIDEHNQLIRDMHESAEIMGFSPRRSVAEGFGRHLIIGSEDIVGEPKAIISLHRLQALVESVFTPESISKQYKKGTMGRFYANDEDEYIVIGARLRADAFQQSDEWKAKRVIDLQEIRRRWEEKNL